MKLTAKLCRWHRLFAALVLLQLMIWLVSGLYFSLTPHSDMKGQQYRQAVSGAPLQHTDMAGLLEFDAILRRFPPTQRLSLLLLDGEPHYLLEHEVTRYPHQCQNHTLVDARSGAVRVLTAATAINLALQSYSGPGLPVAASMVKGANSEWPRQCNPLWRVEFDDPLNTRVYLDASSGALIGHKNRQTVIADWMFRLHFMDYANEGGFNNSIIRLMALLTLMLGASGLGLLINRWCNRRQH